MEIVLCLCLPFDLIDKLQIFAFRFTFKGKAVSRGPPEVAEYQILGDLRIVAVIRR